MHERRYPAGWLGSYFLLTYLVALANNTGFLRGIAFVGDWTIAFVAATYLIYSLAYVAIAFALIGLVDLCFRIPPIARLTARTGLKRDWLTGFAAVAITSFLQVLLYADRFVHDIFGYHLNGFVWNVIITPGGLESMGGGRSTTLTFALIIAGIVALQAVLLVFVMRFKGWRIGPRLVPSRGRLVVLLSLAIVVALFGQGAYGLSSIRGYTPILAASNAFPGYLPLTFTRFARRMGMKVTRAKAITADVQSVRLNYPLAPIRIDPSRPAYNIVWLVAESWRADMLDPEIMPATARFAEQSLRGMQHYSGGNGTRMGIFSMFSGLYGSYWFPMFDERRGVVLVDALLDRGYDIQLYTSALFSYPEFDHTIFARLSHDQMHESPSYPLWQRDRDQITALLGSVDDRDPSRPFMRFMFFESPHANYHFPPESVIREPCGEELNYATMDIQRDIGLMKNRYINACHYLDSQMGRVFDYLSKNKLLDSTIVVIMGDHGEEFLEKGRWGHNSTFSEEQTRTPFVLWVPGQTPKRLTGMTSHLDVPATLLPLIGVTNPPKDYSLGFNLLSDQERSYTVIADWSNVCYVDDRFKAVIPFSSYGFVEQVITDKNDAPVTDRDGFFAERQARLVQVMREMKRFSR